MKYFIVTVDTEGDNSWGYHAGDKVKTENSLWVPKFQELCEKFELNPVYLTNYEMICDDRFVNYIKPKAESGLCEIGIHVHAWNNPPLYDLEHRFDGNPYLIEYPFEIMRQKFAFTYNLIKEKIGMAPVSHRAGRWAMNDDYFQLLEEFNIKVDCSFTPGISWRTSPGSTVDGGSDYSHETNKVKVIGSIYEVPVTILRMHCGVGKLKTRIKYLLKGRSVWLRPATTTLADMKKILDKSVKGGFVEFMLHSSELMPAGSPYFKDDASVLKSFEEMEQLFIYARKKGYIGITLKKYANEF